MKAAASDVRITDTSSLTQTIPFSMAIPAEFTPGQTSSGVTCVNAYTARVTLSPPIKIERNSTAHLISAAVPYTQPNIGPASAGIPGFPQGDNRISITWNGGARTDYFLPQGLYSVPDVEAALNVIAYNAGWQVNATPLFSLTGIAATQSVVLSVNPAALTGNAFPAGGVVIDFLNPSVASLNNSVGPILGWPTSGGSATLTIAGGSTAVAVFDAPNVANFALTSAYALFGSFVTGSYIQGNQGQLISVFPFGNNPTNSVIPYQPPLEFKVPVNAGTYSTFDFWTTDQSGNYLPLLGYQAPFTFSLVIEGPERLVAS